MLKYSKYQGLGNDFIICLDKELKYKNYSKIANIICNMDINGKTDGFISVRETPLEMNFYNRDGSVGTMCGNGLRSFVKYCYDNKIITNFNNDVLTKAGLYETKIIDTSNFSVKVKMGKPNYSASFLEIKTNKEKFINEEILFNSTKYYLTSLFMGTHHTVIFVKDLKELTEELGYFMCHLPIFKDRTNVDFVCVKDKKHIQMKTYERGVGYTLACGTGACASFCVCRLKGLVDERATVSFELGTLEISEDEEGNIYMQGPAQKICDGIIF